MSRIPRCYLEEELLVEGGVEGLAVDLGLKLLLLVRQQVHLDVGVRGASHVHGRELCRLDDAHHELCGETNKETSQGDIYLHGKPRIQNRFFVYRLFFFVN